LWMATRPAAASAANFPTRPAAMARPVPTSWTTTTTVAAVASPAPAGKRARTGAVPAPKGGPPAGGRGPKCSFTARNLGPACTGGKSCENGVCTCPNGGTDCGGTCTNVLFDDANCGACGNACAASEKCFLGTCGCSDPSQLYCDGQCIDGFDDPNNCGRCGNVCPAGQDCIGGECQPPCDDPCHELVNNVCVLKDPSKDSVCNGACVDLNSDQNNCGACGNVCPAGQECVDGACKSPRC